MHLVQESVFLKALGWSLFSSIWQMAVLSLLYYVISAGGKKFTANIRYAIALMLLSIGSIWFIYDLCTFQGNNAPYPLPEITLLNQLDTLSGTSLSAFVFTYFALGYMLLLAFQCTRYFRYYQLALHRRTEGIRKMPPSLRLFVDEIAMQLGIAQKVNIWLSPWAESPLTMGVFKSVILFPVAMINQLSTQQVEALLLHELAHIKRKDYLLNLLVTFSEIIFFFNPFCRVLIQQIRKEMENSCDDLVMQFGYEPRIYCSALLSLEKNRSPLSLALAASGRSDYELLERVRRITGQESKSSPFKVRLGFSLLLIILCGLTLWVRPIQKTRTQIGSIQYLPGKVNKQSENIPYYSFVLNEARVLKIPAEDKATREVKDHTQPAEGKREVTINDESLAEYNYDQSAYPNLVLVSQPEIQPDFSMDPAPLAATTTAPGEPSLKAFPYVAKSSFSFHIVEDTLNAQRDQLNDGEDAADEVLRKAIMAYEQLSRYPSAREKQTTQQMDQLRNLIQATIDIRDLESLIEVENEGLKETDIQRIKGDLELRQKILQNNQAKTPAEIEKLKDHIINGQLKLHRDALIKQLDNLKNLQEFLKKNKIIYI